VGRASRLESVSLSMDVRPLIPHGIYRVRYLDHRTYRAWGEDKLEIHYGVVDIGEAFETVLSRHYPVKCLGKCGVKGKFKPRTATSSLPVEFYQYHPDAPRITRLDRIPMSKWTDGIYNARVETVEKNFQQKPLPRQLQYSVIRELLGRADM